MQTFLKPEVLSKEVKKNLNTIAATIAVINGKINPLNILKSVREINKVSPLLNKFRKQAGKPDNIYSLRNNYLFFEDRLMISDEGRLYVKLINYIHR
jgi:hypothetical protein